MNSTPSLCDLAGNLVPFEAERVPATLIWSGVEDEVIPHLLDECAYLVPEPASPGAPSLKTFFAERYGGSRIGHNGGGARCGFDGRYQVKGIGANPLVGEGTDRHHRNGALATDHAVYEAIWSRVLGQLLPFGAVRAQAVLLTDRYVELDFERHQRRARSALLVRDPSVRPAHFERAPYFRPHPDHAPGLAHDADRVRQAVQSLPHALGARDDSAQACIDAFAELACRLAHQMAFCRTRWLIVTTSPSNVTTDGRLLDFNGLYLLSPGDHRVDFDYHVKLRQLMAEPGVLLEGLTNLCVHLGKYRYGQAFVQPAQHAIIQRFESAFEAGCIRGYIQWLGLPVDALADPLPEPWQRLGGHIRELSGHYLRLAPRPGPENHPPCLDTLLLAVVNGCQPDKQPFASDPRLIACWRGAAAAFADSRAWWQACGHGGPGARDLIQVAAEHIHSARLHRPLLAKQAQLDQINTLLAAHAHSPDVLRKLLKDLENATASAALSVFGTPSATTARTP